MLCCAALCCAVQLTTAAALKPTPLPPAPSSAFPRGPPPCTDFRAAFRAFTSISRAEAAATAALGLLLAGGALLLEDASQALWAAHNQGVSGGGWNAGVACREAGCASGRQPLVCGAGEACGGGQGREGTLLAVPLAAHSVAVKD